MTTTPDILKEAREALEGDWTARNPGPSLKEIVLALIAEVERLETIVEQVKLQAQGWKGEAKTQRSTVHEIYQLVSGATGEPGDWNGASPVRKALLDTDLTGGE